MSVTTDALAISTELLYREARYLDERRWDEWLSLYHEQAVFWVPAWKSESEPTDDPAAEVSLIYTDSRKLLEDRVVRARSGRSIASSPLPRTAHVINNVAVVATDRADIIDAHALSQTYAFDVRFGSQHLNLNVSRCEHRLVHGPDGWQISRKKVIVLNDILPPVFDFYMI